MSTPPNPPSTPSGPPTEPAGTPAPPAAPIPAPARPLSLEKPPAEAPPEIPAPAEASAAAPAEAPAPAPAEAPAPAPTLAEAPAAAEAPAPATAQPAAPAPEATPVPAAPPGSFAPVTPAAAPPPPYGAPYGAPGAHGAQAPGNPWATPAAGYPAPHAAGFPPPPPATNGLAVAALLLGLFGIFVGLIPFFFWAGALLALTGLGLGIAAVVRSRRGAPRATLAAVGTAISLLAIGASVGGWFITTSVIDKIDKKVAEERRNGGYDSGYEDYDDAPTLPGTPARPTPKSAPSEVPGKTSALPWGNSFVYPDGVELTVEGATPYTPSSTAYPPEARNGNAVKVKAKITNKSAATLDVSLALPHARDDKGSEAAMVFDGSAAKMFKGSLLAGESMTATFVFSVPEDTKSLHFELSPGTQYDDAIWSGPIG
ncbi:DUF4352 domain-containing protein [Streptomyces sp. NBC_00096]|uniref:DUF4352 domain-containing protein n=1 Tax=Streptomyces sp. NBC_00096 TaxID=2975650 RepID=UPI0032443942